MRAGHYTRAVTIKTHSTVPQEPTRSPQQRRGEDAVENAVKKAADNPFKTIHKLHAVEQRNQATRSHSEAKLYGLEQRNQDIRRRTSKHTQETPSTTTENMTNSARSARVMSYIYLGAAVQLLLILSALRVTAVQALQATQSKQTSDALRRARARRASTARGNFVDLVSARSRHAARARAGARRTSVWTASPGAPGPR